MKQKKSKNTFNIKTHDGSNDKKRNTKNKKDIWEGRAENSITIMGL